MAANYGVIQVKYRVPDTIQGQSDERLMKNLADDEHSPVSLADINKRFEVMEAIPFDGWPKACKI